MLCIYLRQFPFSCSQLPPAAFQYSHSSLDCLSHCPWPLVHTISHLLSNPRPSLLDCFRCLSWHDFSKPHASLQQLWSPLTQSSPLLSHFHPSYMTKQQGRSMKGRNQCSQRSTHTLTGMNPPGGFMDSRRSVEQEASASMWDQPLERLNIK